MSRFQRIGHALVRIVVCDYSGHPFQAQLSRELARRKHQVLHLHFAEFQTPKGRLSVGPDDPPTLEIEGVSLQRPFAKYSLVRRRFQEIEIARRIVARIRAFAPDVVVGANLPLDALVRVQRGCGRPFVFWQQDIYSAAILKYMMRKYGLAGRLIGAWYRFLEKRALQNSAAVVVISEDFLTALCRDFQMRTDHVTVIPNWAPLDEIVPRPKDNAWSRANQLDRRDVVLYTGTLGMKHDPALMVALASELRSRPDTVVVVVSEGPDAAWVAQEAQRLGLRNLTVLPFQPYEAYSDVLGCADVFVAVLEQEAGQFSVPSKILSYFCAGRPVVASAPGENLCSRLVVAAGAGAVAPAGDIGTFIAAVKRMLDDKEMRRKAGDAARKYAETHFDIRSIADRFETILSGAVKQHA